MDNAQLADMAIRGLTKSYAPYSGFHVSAALLTENGKVYHGVNIENAAFSPSVCAERTAFYKAVSEGERNFIRICIAGCSSGYLETEGFSQGILSDWVPPCGVCRQVMREFCDPESFEILLARSVTDIRIIKLKDILPESFGPEIIRP